MTRNNKTNFTAKRNLLAIVLAIFMCISLCFAVACKNDDSSVKYPDYSYTEVDNGLIKNQNFDYGTVIMDYDEYPKTTVTGWTLDKNSSSKSGVIDTSKLGWKGYMYNVYSDTGMMNYVKSLNGNFTDSDIKNLIKAENISATPKAEDIKEYVVKNYLLSETAKEGVTYAFVNPGTPANATDTKVYMLNNYKTGDLGFGTIQTLTSASEVTLKAGEYAKISVSVKTANLNTANSEIGYGEKIGANIRVKNSFNSNSQAAYGIYNITNTDWADYSFYVKSDDVYETKFTVQLGLGYENHYAEGTVYFDDVRVEILDKEDVASLTFNKENIDYNNLENTKTQISAKNYTEGTNYLYDMAIDMSTLSNAVVVDPFETHDFTQYKGGLTNGNPTNAPKNEVVSFTSENNLSNVPYGIKDGIKVDIKKPASYSIKLKSIALPNENYKAFTFFVKNQLNKMYSTDITVNVMDIYKNNLDVVQEERAAVTKLSEVSEDWTKLTILIQNNFDRNAEEYKNITREFVIEIVIGPDSEQDNIDAYALGTVTISSPIMTWGATYEYENELDEENKKQTDNYNYYTLLKSTATGTTALYAGSSADYSGDEADETVYNIPVSPSDIGTILNKPAAPKNYLGVEVGHYYIGGDEKIIDINTNTSSGVINTKYIDKYDSNVKKALENEEDTIQPLMIKAYNQKSYGFIGENYKIEANAKAKVSLKVKVYGGAEAYIYLVDTTTTQKNVLTFDAFDINTNDGYNSEKTNKHIEEKQLFFKVSDKNEWVNLEFYIASGNTAKEFRLEFWNGDRSDTTNADKMGIVFINDVNVVTTNGFEEPTSWENAFTTLGTPLSDNYTKLIDENGVKESVVLLPYQRELSDIEIEYNNDKDKKGDNVKYPAKYIWAQTDNMIYAIYNTIDPTPYNPYDSEEPDSTIENDSLIKTDPATFWLSFSSILLGVVLVLAIIALFVKNYRRRNKANASDAKSHYTIKSRVSKPKTEKKQKTKEQKEVLDEEQSETTADVEIEDNNLEDQTSEEIQEVVDENKEQTLDDYVYGDVQDFGEQENQTTNQEDQEKDK